MREATVFRYRPQYP